MSNYQATPEMVESFIAENGGMDAVINDKMTGYYRQPETVVTVNAIDGAYDPDIVRLLSEMAAVLGLAVSVDYSTMHVKRPQTRDELIAHAKQWAKSTMPENYAVQTSDAEYAE